MKNFDKEIFFLHSFSFKISEIPLLETSNRLGSEQKTFATRQRTFALNVESVFIVQVSSKTFSASLFCYPLSTLVTYIFFIHQNDNIIVTYKLILKFNPSPSICAGTGNCMFLIPYFLQNPKSFISSRLFAGCDKRPHNKLFTRHQGHARKNCKIFKLAIARLGNCLRFRSNILFNSKNLWSVWIIDLKKYIRLNTRFYNFYCETMIRLRKNYIIIKAKGNDGIPTDFQKPPKACRSENINNPIPSIDANYGQESSRQQLIALLFSTYTGHIWRFVKLFEGFHVNSLPINLPNATY